MDLWIDQQQHGAEMTVIKAFEKKQQLSLPAAYKNLIMQQNGGLIKKNHFPTTEPTSYGLKCGELYSIAGIEELLVSVKEEAEVDLPGQQLYFHQDGSRYLGFSYLPDQAEPSIVYADYETLQVLTVADSFAAFLQLLYFSPFSNKLVTMYSRPKQAQMLAMGNWRARKEILFSLEDTDDKVWYLQQLHTLLTYKEAIYDTLTIALLENQILYFRRKLPAALVEELLEELLRRIPNNEKLNAISAEWASMK